MHCHFQKIFKITISFVPWFFLYIGNSVALNQCSRSGSGTLGSVNFELSGSVIIVPDPDPYSFLATLFIKMI
jgi:hypothetical protein